MVKLYCCGCNSRTCTIIANSFLLAGGCLYAAVSMVGLHDTSQNAPTDDERILLWTVFGSMLVQITTSILGIWGACTYKGWPVTASLVWVSIGVTLGLVGMVLSLNPFLLIPIIIQIYFIWSPMYGYLQDYQELKATAFNYEITSTTTTTTTAAGTADGGYSDNDGGEKEQAQVEMV